MKRILVFDNYDSFTFNLVHLVKQLTTDEVTVVRNDQLDMADAAQFDKIILSPGPGVPAEAGILLSLIKTYAKSKSILGVCLGHQAIGQVFGGQLTNLSKVFHGIKTTINLIPAVSQSKNENDWFKGLDAEIEVGRYHSWVINEQDVPGVLEVTAVDSTGMIMSIRHREYDVQGVQFHPESVLTPNGRKMLENWLVKA